MCAPSLFSFHIINDIPKWIAKRLVLLRYSQEMSEMGNKRKNILKCTQCKVLSVWCTVKNTVAATAKIVKGEKSA